MWEKRCLYKKCFPEIDWKCYVDNNVKPGSIIEGLPVISVEELRRSYPDAYIIVSPRYDYKNIAKQLSSFVDKENIWLYGEKMDFLASKIYFDLPYLTHCDNEIFVDGGVLDGDSSMAFVKWCGGEYGHIHMFEPNPIVHQNINNRMMHFGDKISLHKAGLWNCKDSLSFLVNENHLSGAKIVEDVRESDYTINVIDLDSVLHEGATFIKMDIEGAEKQALLGAKKIIRRYHPKLAISVYHKKEDLWEIPKIILSIDPEYKFYLRHYCLSAGDTVLYGI